jgi:hypothetical protein
MPGLVETHFTSTGKTDPRNRTPSGFLHVCHSDTFPAERGDLRFQVVAHEKQFMPRELFRRMNGHFRRGEREDQPPVTSVHRGKPEYVAEEDTIGCRVLAVENDMRTEDHDVTSGPARWRHGSGPQVVLRRGLNCYAERMSLGYDIYPDIGLLFIRGQGVIAQREPMDAMLAWLRDPEYERCSDAL